MYKLYKLYICIYIYIFCLYLYIYLKISEDFPLRRYLKI